MKKFLLKDLGGVKLYAFLILILLAICGIIVGSFCDLKLTEAVYSKGNFLSEFIEFGGTLPTAVLGGSGGVLLFVFFTNRGNKNDNIYRWLCLFAFLLVAGCYWGFDTFHRHTELAVLSKFYVYAPLGLVVVSLIEIPIYFFVKNGDSSSYPRKAITLLITLLTVLIVTFLIKYLNARARYMWIMEDYDNRIGLFTNWYQFHHKSYFIDAVGGEIENFNLQSWPSGHTSFSSFMTLSFVLTSCNKKVERKGMLFFVISTIWVFIVMLGRILDGHHYLSDVSTGLLITAIFNVLIPFIISKVKTKKKEEQN